MSKNFFIKFKIIYTLSSHDDSISNSRYAFGKFWDYIAPVSTFLIYYFVFSFVLQTKGPENKPYIQYFLMGYIPWIAISDAITSSCWILNKYKFLINKSSFNIQYIPISLGLSLLRNHLILLSIALAFFSIIDDEININFLFLFINIIILSLLIFIITLNFSLFSTYFNDVKPFSGIFSNILFWITPIAWVPSGKILNELVNLNFINPVFNIVTGYRCAINYNKCLIPSGSVYIFLFLFLFILSFLSYKIFIKCIDGIKDEI